ncbi:DNA replication licensing factor, putative [Eimeria maxima]|uniref:DNA replication licensing factor, putative n=1 Tax=Eimeria maxima TaxID=5804 RepID=U6M1Y3_EIMMA|nr:DNA replication licensing factor, putative [Eimeria maxima]CDJ58242.1 DNA replication licensing factor, putative [Eimeria maxima]
MIPLALLELFFPGESQDDGLQQFVALWLDFFSRNAAEVLPMVGCLVSVHGAVVRVYSPQPLVQQLTFECAKCLTKIHKVLQDGRLQEVTAPNGEAAGEGPLDDPTRAPTGGLRTAATIDCELAGFLVGKCSPGDRICLTGKRNN